MSVHLRRWLCAAAVTLSAFPQVTQAAGNWSYQGHTGPAHWHSLKPEYADCQGRNQSPIDIRNSVAAELDALQFNYSANSTNIVNNGHTLQVNFAPGSSLTLVDQQFSLLQLHIHLPAENHIRGVAHPLEVHLVHRDANSNLAVVALLFKEGAQHAGLARLFNTLPAHKGAQHKLVKQSAQALLPTNTAYYRFNGSLTTPPCSEGVNWLVIKQIQTASAAQLAALKALVPKGNARPVQPLNARIVVE